MTTTTETLSLRERAADAAKAAAEESRRGALAQERKLNDMAAKSLVFEAQRLAAKPLRVEDVVFRQPTKYGPGRGAHIAIGEGSDVLWFGMTTHNGWNSLAVEIGRCVRCRESVWAPARNLSELHVALTATECDHGDCLVQYDDDGEPTTDRDGNPLPPRAPAQAKPPETIEGRLLDAIREFVRNEIGCELELR